MRFVWAGVNTVIVFRCRPKQPHRDPSEPVPDELSSGSFVMRTWSYLDPTQLLGVLHRFIARWALHSGMNQGQTWTSATTDVVYGQMTFFRTFFLCLCICSSPRHIWPISRMNVLCSFKCCILVCLNFTLCEKKSNQVHQLICWFAPEQMNYRFRKCL